GNWDAYRAKLIEFFNAQADLQKLSWGDLIGDLLKQWELRHEGLTAAKKRESLEHVLSSTGSNQETLFGRLQGLIRNWSQQRGSDAPATGIASGPEHEEPEPAEARASGPGSRASELLSELRELFAFTLETAIATQLIESPSLAADARTLATEMRRARTTEELHKFLDRLKCFAFKLELLAEDQAELRRSLLNLLRLMVENVSELVIDDRWLQGQVEVVRKVVDAPLSQRAVDDAERRLREVLFKQSQLKHSLQEAKDALKSMLAGFVDHLAGFADATSDYHDTIEACAAKISAANDITELENVIAEVMRETRTIQLNAQRSRDELRASQQKAAESEARIRELEMELEKTSELVRYDQLTGALNRRGLEEIMDKEMARANRHETLFSLALLDLDNFKKLNDSLGHEAGDEALIHLTAVCRDTLRPQDTVARFGGEEFVILLPETGIDDAVNALVRLQRELTKRFFMHDNKKVLITFSAGATQLRPGDDRATITKRADEAMYRAKKSGKNRVEVA
ncbi:MAG TPA: diguanylate cyclase, partial [Rhodocyclaceae bacterium]|nr:diguanylate cyclase [Rhodocyclaceae bacterium]